MTGTTFKLLAGTSEHCDHCGCHITKHTIGSYDCPVDRSSALFAPRHPFGETPQIETDMPDEADLSQLDFYPGKVHWVGKPPENRAERLEDHPLYPIFMAAIEQAMYGKGERHGGARTPFLDQPWVHYLKMHGRGFATGQAAKKLEEAASTREGVGFETEVFGAIVYAGMAILKERGEV